MPMRGTVTKACVFAIIAALLSASCGGKKNVVNPPLDDTMPRKIIWAWERPEDVRPFDPSEFGVAFLAQTILLERDQVTPDRRRQPLEIAPGTYLIAVTRIETQKDTFRRPSFDSEMVSRTVSLIRSTLELPNVKGIQID